MRDKLRHLTLFLPLIQPHWLEPLVIYKSLNLRESGPGTMQENPSGWGSTEEFRKLYRIGFLVGPGQNYDEVRYFRPT